MLKPRNSDSVHHLFRVEIVFLQERQGTAIRLLCREETVEIQERYERLVNVIFVLGEVLHHVAIVRLLAEVAKLLECPSNMDDFEVVPLQR